MYDSNIHFPEFVYENLLRKRCYVVFITTSHYITILIDVNKLFSVTV